jgi:transposase
VSDTHAITTFARYVDMKRRPLTEILCIDEVHVGSSKKCNYALIIQDFLTGEPIDMALSRREEVTLPYFTNIPLKERKRVKYLIMDMYCPYLAYVDKYFYHARPVVDAFHVIQLINRYFLRYIRSVQRRLDQRDRAVHEQREQEFKRKLPFTHSKDYLLLKKYHWMLLKNQQDIHYYRQPRLNRQFGRMMNTFDYEEWLYRIEPNFREIRSLKEKYITFNQRYHDRPKEAKKGLRELIDTYRHCRFSMFHEIADTLEEFSGPIVDSFHLAVRTDKSGKHLSRLSNGPIESINRIPKDMKRIGRGYLNFEHLRNRFLFSQRKNARILGSPKSLNEIYLKIEPIRY